MQTILPNFLIAIGGLALVTQRNRWAVLGALFLQWIGLALQIAQMPVGTSGVLVEIVAAMGCCGILGLTVWNLEHTGADGSPKTEARSRQFSIRNPQFVITDQLWLWATALVAGVAGFALAQIYPLGGSAQDLITFYWMLLPSVLALVIDGSRDEVKLAAGTLALFNAGLLLVYLFGAGPPGVVLIGMAALGRLALAAVFAYTWLFFKTNYPVPSLSLLFDLRDGKDSTETALALVPESPHSTGKGVEAEVADDDAE